MKPGPIILIEDDADDKAIIDEIISEMKLPNKLHWFTNCPDAYHYLDTTVDRPFLILCDVNLPIQSGTEFKKQVDAHPELRKKSIPFVFYTTSASKALVEAAYTEMTVQGFFKKKNSYEEVKENIRLILDYWSECLHPNSD
ncbi:MAG: response regulator [Ferruginibacter sp.]